MKFIFWNEDHCKLLVLHSDYLLYMHSFSVLTLWHTYADSHPDNGSKRSHYGLENCHILLKNVLLKMNFQHCLFYILTFYHKLLLFQFLGRRICLQIPILTGVQKGHVSLWKSGHNFEAWFPTSWSLLCLLLDLYPDYLLQRPSSSILKLWYTNADSHPDRGLKKNTVSG